MIKVNKNLSVSRRRSSIGFALYPTLLATLLLVGACSDDDPDVVVEPEEITTLRLRFEPTGGGSAIVANWQDLDGDGGNDPVVANFSLAANTEYKLTVMVLNENEEMSSDEYDVTEEVKEKLEEHQFFFEYDGDSGENMTFTYDDSDKAGSDGKPVGLTNIVKTTDAGTGSLKVTLIHEPNKSAEGVSGGDITNAGGEPDVETVPPFEVNIQ